MVKVLISGDFSVQYRSKQLFTNVTKATKVFESVKEICAAHDFSIVNFESPVTDDEFKILKDGPSLKNPANSIDVLKEIGFKIFTLANNHLKDYGWKGVEDTITFCRQKGAKIVGAGKDICEAREPLVIEHEGFKVGIVNVCENESSIATIDEAGANPIDLINLFYDITKVKSYVDNVIVIIHGGREHYQLPTPRMKKLYHYIIDLGADIIVNHHQHCFSGYEIYNNKPIFYGLGNFYFDNKYRKGTIWNQGLMLSIEIGNSLTWKLIPIEQCNNAPDIKVLSYENIKDKIMQLNDIILDDEKLCKAFEKESIRAKSLSPMQPYNNHYIRALYHRNILPDLISTKKKIEILNLVRCETHREILITNIETLLKHE